MSGTLTYHTKAYLRMMSKMKLCQVIILIVIITMVLIHWQEKSFAGTVELDSSNINSMTRVNLYNNIWQQPKGFLWYNEQLEQQSNKLPVAQSKLSLKLKSESVIEPHDERIESLKQQFNRAQRKALDVKL
ncbi:hypothetical protein JRD95_00790 [Rickettsia parkeri]|nr:hypothetical protein JRD95_00790 [Rickettsia parkeri]